MKGLIFKSGVIPEIWVSGTIKPFYKNKGDKFNPKNYRPITIVSCLGKLFTAVLNASLSEFSDEMGTFSCMKKTSKSFKNKENRNGDTFSPCRSLFHMENIQISFHHKINKI
jgi:hypothetical protein